MPHRSEGSREATPAGPACTLRRVFARRAAWDLAHNPLTLAADASRARGAELVDLTESNPTRCGLLEGGVALSRALADLARSPDAARYAPTRGARERASRSNATQRARRRALDRSSVLTESTSEATT